MPYTNVNAKNSCLETLFPALKSKTERKKKKKNVASKVVLVTTFLLLCLVL